MSKFEINDLFGKRISVNIFCLNCDEEFSTELDTDYLIESQPSFNNETLYCIHCEKSYDYTIKIDSNKLEVIFKNNDIFGKIEYPDSAELHSVPTIQTNYK